MPDRTMIEVNGSSAMEHPSKNLSGDGVGSAFVQIFKRAAAERWSGKLELVSPDGEEAGAAVFWEGRLAWATSRTQTETLGSFLRRLGQVTSDDLDIVQVLFEEHGGEKKLGHIMEETGIIPRRALRRCLRLHLRLAVASLLGPSCSVSSVHAGTFCGEDDISFDVQEIIPEWNDSVSGASTDLPTGPADAVTTVLEMLKNIPGHACSLVADREGSVIAVRGLTATDVPGPSVLAGTAVTLLESAMHSATWNDLGEVDFASTEGSNGAVLAQWLDPERAYLAAVMLAPTGKVGIARYELAASAKVFSRNYRTTHRNGGNE